MKTLVVLVLLLFVDGEPVDGRVGGPFDSMAACEMKRADAEARAKEMQADAVLKCVELSYKPKPAVLRQRGSKT